MANYNSGFKYNSENLFNTVYDKEEAVSSLHTFAMPEVVTSKQLNNVLYIKQVITEPLVVKELM